MKQRSGAPHYPSWSWIILQFSEMVSAHYTRHMKCHVSLRDLTVVCECTHIFRKITGSVNAANLTIREQMPQHITRVFSGISVWKGLWFGEISRKCRRTSTLVDVCLETCCIELFLHCERVLTPHDIVMKSLQSMSVSTHGWKTALDMHEGEDFRFSSGSIPKTSALLFSKHSAWSVFHSVYVFALD